MDFDGMMSLRGDGGLGGLLGAALLAKALSGEDERQPLSEEGAAMANALITAARDATPALEQGIAALQDYRRALAVVIGEVGLNEHMQDCLNNTDCSINHMKAVIKSGERERVEATA